jgi:hypothetical protein
VKTLTPPEARLEFKRDATRLTQTSVPVYTTQPPIPGGEPITEAAILAEIGTAGRIKAELLPEGTTINGVLSGVEIETAPVNAVAASGVIFYGTAGSGYTVTVNGELYEYAPFGKDYNSITALTALLNAREDVSAAHDGTNIYLAATNPGVAGNAITLEANGHTVSGATLTNGRAGTVASDPTIVNLFGEIHAVDSNTALQANWRKLFIQPENTIVVQTTGNTVQNGENLHAAYAAAKLLKPNGLDLSAANRAIVLLPPATYQLTSAGSGTLELDTDFVDLIAMVPDMPKPHLATDTEIGNFVTSLGQFRPGGTLVFSYQGIRVIDQTARDIRMDGFSVANLNATASVRNKHAFIFSGTGDNANDRSIYTRMYFYMRSVFPVLDDGLTNSSLGVGFAKHFAGTWVDCVAGSYSWRIGEDGVCTATMIRCIGGGQSFGGDNSNISFGACRFEQCKCIGISQSGGVTGQGGFGGCIAFGTPSTADSWFVECESGPNSFSVGFEAAGNYIRCRGGDWSFGATFTTGTNYGNFSGYAEDCVGGKASFGGTTQAGQGKCTGTLVRCKVEGNTVSMRLEGANIRDSRIVATTTGIHAVTLLDSASVISNSDLIVLQGGTGLPIYAAAALNVAAYACRMNNATNDADGLGANVTNLVTSAANVVSDAVT